MTLTERGRDGLRQVAVVLALALTVTVNALANALPLAGRDTGAVSDLFKGPFTPAGFTFAIWAVIYLGLIAYAVYQALPANAANPRLRRVGWLFVLSCLANVAWLFAWHNLALTLSIPLMLVLLGCLIAIYLRLEIGRETPRDESLFVRLPFSLYLGWITVATVANVSAWLVSLGATRLLGLPPELWAASMALVASLIGARMSGYSHDVPYNLVLLWAFAGILGAQPGVNLTVVGVVLAAFVVVAGLLLRRPQPTLPSAARV